MCTGLLTFGATSQATTVLFFFQNKVNCSTYIWKTVNLVHKLVDVISKIGHWNWPLINPIPPASFFNTKVLQPYEIKAWIWF